MTMPTLPFGLGRARKGKLLAQMTSKDNAIALKAVSGLQELLYFQDGTLHGTDLSGANLRDVCLARASLQAVNLSEASLTGGYFGATDLRRAVLRLADLSAANLREVLLEGADLEGARLTNAHLALANLTGAILRGANLDGANLWKARLHGADLTGASLRGANLDRTEFDARTILPDGLPWTPHHDLQVFVTD
jgi:uncharacterized protein YjbI with pentapeptide repeats